MKEIFDATVFLVGIAIGGFIVGIGLSITVMYFHEKKSKKVQK